MSWHQGYIAVDWGTTNRRAYRVEARGMVDSLEDEWGVTTVPAGGFAQAVAAIRDRMGDLPMLLSGMVGSDRGWREAPYVDVPAGDTELAAGIVWMDARTGIVPGVCQRGAHGPDVMRGEEVQAIGAVAAGMMEPDSLACHPGTHAKWVELDGGRIARFRTVMTGELFALMRQHSILAGTLTGQAMTGTAFDEGVAEIQEGVTPLSALFRIRARGLLEGELADGASRASGILIGSEVAAALSEFPDMPVAVVGRPDLGALYCRALQLMGRDARPVDGAAAFLSGIAALTRKLR